MKEAVMLLGAVLGLAASAEPQWILPGGGMVTTAFPAANIAVDRVDGDRIDLHQDLRDTEGWWFWWCFGVRGAGGRTLTFHFTNREVLGTRGPALSSDGGRSWSWLGPQPSRSQFRYAFPATANDVRFAFAIPYTGADLERFLARHAGNRHLCREELCRSPKGRPVELLRAGRLDGQAPLCLLLTARHHACESIAGFELEGILEAILADSATGAWFRETVEVLAVPFVDKDGVEDGDQGKNRRPRDHNRDYADASVHITVQAIRALVPAWSRGRPLVALDLHCPYLSGAYNEHVYFVGQEDPRQWQETTLLATLLEQSLSGPVPYAAADNLPFGKAWNTGGNYSTGCSFARWAQALPGTRLAATIEFPYANVKDWTVEPEGVRAFGHDLSRALRRYFQED
jgi:hypothetical protein